MEAYLKHKENLYYKIITGRCEVIDTERKSYKNNTSLPSGMMRNIQVISKEEYEQAKKIIGL